MDPTLCRICGEAKLTLPEQQAYGVCAECFRLPGFYRLPRMTRAIGPCSACGGRERVRAVAFERGAQGGEYAYAYAAPLSVAFRQTRNDAWVSGSRIEVAEDDLVGQIGVLEMLICRSCGLVTWHALEPHKIPIGPEFGTELVRVDDDGGPYR